MNNVRESDERIRLEIILIKTQNNVVTEHI